MNSKLHKINEALAVALTRAFGTMWMCYLFMVYGILPLFALFHGYQDSFLYWSNWVQLWSLPLILVGTNILGRDAEERSKLDHAKLAQSYAEQQETYRQILALLKRQEEMMADMARQDRVLDAQDAVLTRQSEMLRREIAYLAETRPAPKPDDPA